MLPDTRRRNWAPPQSEFEMPKIAPSGSIGT
jgi:hypothetical protein